MRKDISSTVCAFGEKQCKCIEVVNTYNPYAKYIIAGLSIIAVLALGILVIYLVKQRAKRIKTGDINEGNNTK